MHPLRAFISAQLGPRGGRRRAAPLSVLGLHRQWARFRAYPWDTDRVPEDSRWPASDAELYHGMRAPDYASFARAHLDKRLAPVLRAFEASPEYRAEFERRPRYTAPFLTMTAGVYLADLTDLDDEPHDTDIADELICDLPIYAYTADPDEAPRMLAELRARSASSGRAATNRTRREAGSTAA